MKGLSKKYPVIIILGILFSTFACKKKDFLSGYDKDVLFAPASKAETDYIFDNWNKRDLNPTDYSVLKQVQILDGKFELRIVSYEIAGIEEYGALIVPQQGSSMPVRMHVGGFGLNHTVNSITLKLDSAASGNPCILAIPALRGQSLEITLNGTVYTSPLSGGIQCDAFDGATDDVIAFLNLIEQTESKANTNRTAVMGGSRGGTVALLAGIRDKRIKRVVDVAGPTNLLELTSQNVDDLTYQCQFLDALKNNQATLAETRNKLIASSPLYFAQHLPLTQLHLGINDTKVPVHQGDELAHKMSELGMGSGFQLYKYNRSHEDIAKDNTELTERIEDFLSQL